MKQATPPRLATWLLLWFAPRAYRDALAGDLYEEFVSLGRTRTWYWRQVARSLPKLIAGWEQPVAAFLMAAAWLLVGWHFLWSFVLSQIPLKADPIAWF